MGSWGAASGLSYCERAALGKTHLVEIIALREQGVMGRGGGVGSW